MSHREWKMSVLSIVFALVAQYSSAEDPPRKILVELYSSQGCDSCPPASDLLGKLAKLGYGPDRIVPINFHVDYFNNPWVDPFSEAEYSRRQLSYNDVLKRDDLYFTPLMMVDGRYPLLGSDRSKALAALERAKKEEPGVKLEITLNGADRRKTLSVKIAARSDTVVGRELLIGMALTENPVSTKVPSGENAGKTLVEHHVARKFDHKTIKLKQKDSQSLSFPLELTEGWEPERFRVTVFAQDRLNGKIYQADSIAWVAPRMPGPSAERTSGIDRTIAKRRVRHAANHAVSDISAMLGMMNSQSASTTTSDPAADLINCSDCGTSFTVQSFFGLPPGMIIPADLRIWIPPSFVC